MTGETVFIRGSKHLSKNDIAYVKWICLCSAAVFVYLHSEFKGYANLSDITFMKWLEMLCWSVAAVANTTIAFIDKSANAKTEEPKPRESEIKL